MTASRILVATCFLLVAGAAQQASAQYNPFQIDNLARQQQYQLTRPTVSPYLNLLNLNNQQASLPNYQTLVRPQLDQRQESQQQQRQIRQLNQQVSNIDRRSLNNQQGSATGHPTRFMTYSHYYPGLQR